MADDDKDTSVLEEARAAYEGLNREPEPAAVTAPDVSRETPAVETTGDRARDEAGKFAKRETLTLKPKDQVAGEPVPIDSAAQVANPAPVDPNAKPAEAVAPPVEWKGGGKVQWNRLPKEVQAELRATYEGLAADRAATAPFKELLDSHSQLLINEAGSTQEGMRQLFQLARLSVDNPVGLIHHIAQTKGIDLRALVGGQQAPAAGNQQQQPTDIQSLVAAALKQELAPLQQQFQQQQLNQTMSSIETFRSDPKHPYFNDVADHMEKLLKSGAAKDLPEAYEQATWANPTIRAQLQQQQSEELVNKQKAEAAAALKARAASLTGSPIPGAQALNGSGSNSSALDDVRAAARELAGA